MERKEHVVNKRVPERRCSINGNNTGVNKSSRGNILSKRIR